jgi:transcriptional antiterminator NusG
MSTLQDQPPSLAPPASVLTIDDARWFAVHTRARHEKKVDAHFEEKRLTSFLPLLQRISRWSDRTALIDTPLFGGYTFVRISPTAENRVIVLRTSGVLGLVGNGGMGTPIPDEEIYNLQTVLQRRAPCSAHPFTRAGQRVRIRGGCLDGVEGILQTENPDQTLILSIELLQRSLSIRVSGYDIEPL